MSNLAPPRNLDELPKRDDALTREVDAAASLLTVRERQFCDMTLQRDILGMTLAECYVTAGYPVGPEDSATHRAYALLDRRHLRRYIVAIQSRCMEDVGLSLAQLDAELLAIIESDISNFIGTRGLNRVEVVDGEAKVVGTSYIPELRCNIDDLTPTQRRSIQSIEMTTNGVKVKQYDRLAALQLAYKRLGALVEKKEHSGPGGSALPTPLIQLLAVSTSGTESKPAYAALLPADATDTDERLKD